MLREAPYVDVGKEVASVLIVLLMMGAFAAALVIIPPQLPIDETVTIAPYSHRDYNRAMPTGRNVNIEIRVLESPPPGLDEILSFSILDQQNYVLKMNGSPSYVILLRLAVYSKVSPVWQVPADGEYFFVLENPNDYNVTAEIKILYSLEWTPLLGVAIVLSSILIAIGALRYDAYRREYGPTFVELRGDLDMIPTIVSHAPERINYIVITRPPLKKCAVCNLVIGEEESVLRCPYCGGLAHKDHFLENLRTKGKCPACGRQIDEQDLQPDAQK